jgi:heme A synthase
VKRGPPQVVAGRLEDWERTVAFSIGVVTLTAALFTFLAVRQDDASSEARGQAILETLQVQRQQLVGAIRVQAEAAAADRYRRSLAEAEALESQAAAEKSAGHAGRAAELRADASALRYVADSYKETMFDAGRLSGTTSAATYDTSRRLETIQAYQAFEAIQPDQPEHTAQVADGRHEQSIRTLAAVVLLLVLVVLLTLGRILPARWRGAVLAAAVAGAVAAGVGTLVNAVG